MEYGFVETAKASRLGVNMQRIVVPRESIDVRLVIVNDSAASHIGLFLWDVNFGRVGLTSTSEGFDISQHFYTAAE